MAKVIQVTQYEANDGSLFLTEAECDAHDFKLLNGAKIDAAKEAFLNTTKAIDRSRNMQGNVIENFLAFYLPWVEAGEPVKNRFGGHLPSTEGCTRAKLCCAGTDDSDGPHRLNQYPSGSWYCQFQQLGTSVQCRHGSRTRHNSGFVQKHGSPLNQVLRTGQRKADHSC